MLTGCQRHLSRRSGTRLGLGELFLGCLPVWQLREHAGNVRVSDTERADTRDSMSAAGSDRVVDQVIEDMYSPHGSA